MSGTQESSKLLLSQQTVFYPKLDNQVKQGSVSEHNLQLQHLSLGRLQTILSKPKYSFAYNVDNTELYNCLYNTASPIVDNSDLATVVRYQLFSSRKSRVSLEIENLKTTSRSPSTVALSLLRLPNYLLILYSNIRNLINTNDDDNNTLELVVQP